jgi:YD repeat-containing protein
MLLRHTFTFIPPAALALALALSSAAAAQTTTFHDAAGRVTGKATTRNGATTFYDSAGRVTGKARTNAEGTTRSTTPPVTSPAKPQHRGDDTVSTTATLSTATPAGWAPRASC